MSQLADIGTRRSLGTEDNSIGLNTSTGANNVRQEVPESISPIRQSSAQSKPMRAQILEAEQQYLDPEHLVLPRMQEPYPDLNK